MASKNRTDLSSGSALKTDFVYGRKKNQSTRVGVSRHNATDRNTTLCRRDDYKHMSGTHTRGFYQVLMNERTHLYNRAFPASPERATQASISSRWTSRNQVSDSDADPERKPRWAHLAYNVHNNGNRVRRSEEDGTDGDCELSQGYAIPDRVLLPTLITWPIIL